MMHKLMKVPAKIEKDALSRHHEIQQNIEHTINEIVTAQASTEDGFCAHKYTYTGVNTVYVKALTKSPCMPIFGTIFGKRK